jgi:hypothetical protein
VWYILLMPKGLSTAPAFNILRSISLNAAGVKWDPIDISTKCYAGAYKSLGGMFVSFSTKWALLLYKAPAI